MKIDKVLKSEDNQLKYNHIYLKNSNEYYKPTFEKNSRLDAMVVFAVINNHLSPPTKNQNEFDENTVKET